MTIIKGRTATRFLKGSQLQAARYLMTIIKGGGNSREGPHRFIASSESNAAEAWFLAVGRELVDLIAKAYLHIAALWLCIEFMRCQIKGQIICIHVGIVE